MPDDEEKDPAAEDMPPAKPGEDDAPAACAKCEDDLTPGAKFCASCGAAVSAAEPEEEEAPPSSKPAPAPPPDASVAAVLGLRPGASAVAVKTAAHALRCEVDHVRKVLGSDSIGATRGALKALAEDAAKGAKAAADLKKTRAQANRRERIDLLTSLAKANLPGFPRGDLLVDKVNAEGTATISVEPAGHYAAVPLADLRGFVKGKLANAAPAQRSPYAPNEEASKAAANAAPTGKIAALSASTGISAESLATASASIDLMIGVAQ